MMDRDGVRTIALAMPDVVEASGKFKVRGKLLARLIDADTLAVGADIVDLKRAKSGELRELLFEAYRVLNPEKGLRAKVASIFLALPGVEEHLSQFSGRRAFWVGGREIAHFHDGDVIEIRGKRAWKELIITKQSLDEIASLAAESVAANAAAGRQLKRPRGRRH
jgi:hypothetical protein